MSRWICVDDICIPSDENDWEELVAFADAIAEQEPIDIVCCGECVYYDPPHVDDKGKRIEYKDLPKEAFDELGTGLVNISYGINVGGRCCVDYNCGYGEDKRVYRAECDFCRKGRRPLNSSEKPNNSKVSEKPTGSTRSKMEQVEPQTCSFSDCDNFKNPNYERCIECKRKQIKLKTEQTERSE